jgi:predicted 2-oxoglutarate/Fe(II)-dependent dioxygenase YbiX
MIIQVADAVSAEDCRRLMTLYDRNVQQAKVRDYTGHPVVYWPQFRDAPYAAEIVPRLVEECLFHTGSRLQLADPVYPETVILAAIGAGGHHSRHADNCRQNEQGDWVANHTPHRDVSAIYYLNDEFDGGEIFFEQAQLMVKPRRGLLLAFPSDADHVHEVLPVSSGVRYTMVIWFTKQKCFALEVEWKWGQS